jgi:hypothetical protein
MRKWRPLDKIISKTLDLYIWRGYNLILALSARHLCDSVRVQLVVQVIARLGVEKQLLVHKPLTKRLLYEKFMTG